MLPFWPCKQVEMRRYGKSGGSTILSWMFVVLVARWEAVGTAPAPNAASGPFRVKRYAWIPVKTPYHHHPQYPLWRSTHTPSKPCGSSYRDACARTLRGGRLCARDKREETPALPITLISGFAVSAKASLLRHILDARESTRLAILTEDLESLSEEGVEKVLDVEEGALERVLELSDGSVCCSARSDMLEEAIVELLDRHHKEGHVFDSLIVDSNAVSEPMLLAEQLADMDQAAAVRVDTMVTVTDSATFLSELTKADTLQDRGMSTDEYDGRTVADVLVAQVEYANVIVTMSKKTAKSPEAKAKHLEGLLHMLNPDAKIIRGTMEEGGRCGDMPPLEAVVRTGAFVMAKAEVPGWLRLLQQDTEREAGHGGVSAVVFRSRRPFHPERLWSFIHQDMKDIERSKGFFWLATRNDLMGLWSQAGGSFVPENGGPWWAATDRDLWPDDAGDKESILADFVDGEEGVVGDRRQELVLIGREPRDGYWVERLSECLLHEGEEAGGLHDPFPLWEMEDDDHDHDHDHGH